MSYTIVIWLIFLQIVAFNSGDVAGNGMHVLHKERRLEDVEYDRRGYISIDCGNDQPFSTGGIAYLTDSPYIDTGTNNHIVISSEFASEVSDTIDNTLRSFPNGLRNCYTFMVDKENKYLIRAELTYGNYDGKNFIPTFDIYVGVNFWWRVNPNDTMEMLFDEIIHKPTEDSIHICLINIGQGTPFIFALLLRPLNNSIYDTDKGSLTKEVRFDTGLFDNGLYESEAEDIYDRLWASLPSESFKNWAQYNSSTNLEVLTNDAYKVPPSFFKQGAQPLTGERSLSFHHTPINNGSVFYVYLHFAETEKLAANESREFQIFLNGSLVAGPIKPTYLESLTIASPAITLGPEEPEFYMSINQTKASTLPPVLNALEIYRVTPLSQSATNQDDVTAIGDIKKMYGSIIGWQGDPCLPVSPWDGLGCSNNSSNSPSITSLNLSSRGLIGEISSSINSLKSLKYLNLSDNSLTGKIPAFLANMPSLKVIDLSGNKLSGSVPVKLTDQEKNGLTLRLDGNPDLCISKSCTKISNKQKILAAASASLLVLLIVIAAFYVYRWKRKPGNMKGIKSKGGMKSEKRLFTYLEVINMTQNFQITIGKGASGTVYRGTLEDGSVVAVKLLNQSSSLSLKSFQTEAELLTRVHHRNLVSLVGYCEEGTTMALICEFVANGNLQEQLSGAQAKNLSWKKRLQISIDAAQGLDYLHSGCKPAIVHRDMKTANILLDDKLHAKIADFGISRIFATESASHISTNHVAGTPGYLDPECHVLYTLNEKSDVYSFGVILLELITGHMPICKSADGIIHISNWVTPFMERGDIHNIVDKRICEDYETNSIWRALETAMKCVSSTVHQRPNMSQVLADLKECLALQLAHDEMETNGGDQIATNYPNNSLDGIYVDSEAIHNPMAR